MNSLVSHTNATSKKYQNFLRSAEKTLIFSGSDSSDVNEWITFVEEMADTHGADHDEILLGLKTLLSKSARRFYREHLLLVQASN